jgi:hypothetical protein
VIAGRRCLRCGLPLTGPVALRERWSYCHRCWRGRKQALNSWHYQLEEVAWKLWGVTLEQLERLGR